MLKTLLKKQFLSVFGGFNKGKKQKSAKGVSGYVALIALMFVCFAFIFFGIMVMLCKPLCDAGLEWLYFVYAGILAVFIAVIGGIFMAQTQLYEAKDNDMLLSLPIPPKYILFVRMAPLYAQNFLFCAAALLPSFIAYALVCSVSFGQVIIWILTLILQPFLSLFITCLLGFLLALITSKMRDKTLITVILSIVFLVAYMIVYMQLVNYVNALIANSEAIGGAIKSYLYTIYAFGIACGGDFAGFAISTGVIAVLFGGLYLVLSKTYIKIVTGKRSSARAKFKGRAEKLCSTPVALVKKETRRFFSSGIYFLNCGLGVILMLIGTFFMVIKYGELTDALNSLEGGLGWLADTIPVLLCLATSFICVMDEVSAPSISLEGKNLWILQSSPIDMWQVIKSKLIIHYLVTAPVATVCMAVFAALVQPSWGMIILMLITPSVATTLSGVLGIEFNLKKPNLDWDNETTVIKQSMSVLLTMLTCWGIILAVAGIGIGLGFVIGYELSLLIGLLLMAGVSVGVLFLLKKKGVKILQNL